MAASRQDIEGWLKRAQESGATHLIVVCDTFDHEDYPVFVKPGDDVEERVAHYRTAEMQRVMEVYNLALSIEDQMAEHRAWHM